ncbi:SF1B family DNA helicase RecD2 [Lachnobacterium bovis]|uniref:ATP-dependent RecD2 DNA helicase n=1 Tax=Lachnobacterium bovis DSM 14045 TaxID=1122142 RepID=A0A1H3HC23_9FIRM|nr:ATP-dependent RecD-like DNA helicase [Lachnobacterium bovis]SDY13056.1 exodeoxyribonuclease V alpha subunit [Lachnobacterium bovis DSM 14045]
METISGYVDHIIFRNEENGYTVLVLVSDGEEVTCVGIFTDISEGENIECVGEFIKHSTYGEQFKTTSYEHKDPEDIVSIERYLGSGAVKGLGKALASRIVKKFKEDTFRIIEEEPERLAEIKGISQQKAMDIANQINERKDLRRAMIYLQKYGISTLMAVKIYKTYKQDVFKILKENPYKLSEDIGGIGFKTADLIASKIGIKPDSDFRVQSGVLYTLQQASLEGHTYLPFNELIEQSINVLNVSQEQIETNIMNLAIERKIVITDKNDDKQVFYAPYYYMEANSARMLKGINDYYEVSEIELEKDLEEIQKKTKMTLDEAQKDAVRAAARNGLLVITGGPGTGKTTTINSIIQYFEMNGLDIFLAAPTGRAAKRMSETTGFEAKTIHRMLELNGGVGGATTFEKNSDNPLEADVIIIDEMSMVDINLMNALLKAIIPGQTRLILVGDVSQLPSVGPGSVLKDIIDSNCFKTVALTKIFRQASTSDIIVNAHKINAGEMVLLDNKSKDFFFLKRYEAEKIINVTLQLIIQKLPKYVDATSYDIQVLTPMRKGLLGVERLNGILQAYINPQSDKKSEKEHNGRIFREGDKVMQMKNNYQMEWEIKSKYGLAIDKGTGIFNGDVGKIERINEYTDTMTIIFDDNKTVEYPYKMLDELDLAYAITIHKSQGSEYPAIVIPLLTGPSMLMNRNLLYTAVTRAKKCVTIVGNDKTFDMMVKNVSQQKRYSGLIERLKEDFYDNKKI